MQIVEFQPVELGPALKYFFNNAKMNIYQGQIPINLLDHFPMLKAGYGRLNIVYKMLNNYIIINNLRDPTDTQFVVPDDDFLKAFNGHISSLYYLDMLTEEAINKQLITKGINTFSELGLNSERYDIKFNDDIIDRNVVTRSMHDVRSKGITEYNLNYENRLSIEIFYILKELTEDSLIQNTYPYVSFYHFIITGLSTYNDRIITENLIQNRWIHLLYAIIREDSDQILGLLRNLDPRINNNEAYRLASQIGTSKIIKIIKDDIIHITMLERQVATQHFENLIGSTDIPQSLFQFK